VRDDAVARQASAQANPVGADLMFEIHQSGSMDHEFSTLYANISSFVNGIFVFQSVAQ
jgi:hypothetical protein